MSERPYGSRNCIVCGRHNPAGLQVTYRAEDGRSRAEVTPPERFQGFDGTLHGGIVSALLDDAMWYAAFSTGLFTMTAELTVRFKQPVPVGEAVHLAGWVRGRRGRLVELAAELRRAGGGEAGGGDAGGEEGGGEAGNGGAGGEVLAEAAGKFLVVPDEMRQRLGGADIIQSLDE